MCCRSPETSSVNAYANAYAVCHTEDMNTTSPVIGSKVRATTTTPACQDVTIEVSAIDREVVGGWYVYGYRTHRGTRPRQTLYPRLYFVAR